VQYTGKKTDIFGVKPMAIQRAAILAFKQTGIAAKIMP
jgi:hypothetical protein